MELTTSQKWCNNVIWNESNADPIINPEPVNAITSVWNELERQMKLPFAVDDEPIIRLAGINECSTLDGRGLRFVIFTQGCMAKCAGCHNQHTWSFDGGYDEKISVIIERINRLKHLLTGVTFSGGEPFFQYEGCAQIAKWVKENTQLDIWCYSGHTYEYILRTQRFLEFVRYIDVLVDGPFDISKKTTAQPFKGSSNQRILDMNASRFIAENGDVRYICPPKHFKFPAPTFPPDFKRRATVSGTGIA